MLVVVLVLDLVVDLAVEEVAPLDVLGPERHAGTPGILLDVLPSNSFHLLNVAWTVDLIGILLVNAPPGGALAIIAANSGISLSFASPPPLLCPIALRDLPCLLVLLVNVPWVNFVLSDGWIILLRSFLGMKNSSWRKTS